MKKQMGILLLLAAVACQRGGDVAVTDTGGGATTGTTTTTAGGGTLNTPVSTVLVTFTGANTFVTPPGKDMRVAMLAGEAGMEHVPHLYLPDDVVVPAGKTAEQFLTEVTQGTVVREKGRFDIKINKPLAVRIVDGTGVPPSPATAKEASYEQLMPSLQALDPSFSDLDDDFNNTVPAGTDIVAFFHVNGGTLSAAPYCGYIGLKQADGTVKYEKWAREVFLTATTASTPAKLQIDTGSGWQDVTFTDSSFLDIRYVNQPANAGQPHMDLHGKVSKTNTITLPSFNNSRECLVQQGIPIGCGASEYP